MEHFSKHPKFFAYFHVQTNDCCSKYFELIFGSCYEISEDGIEELFESFKKLRELKSLRLNYYE